MNSIIDYPANFDVNKPTEIIFFATPDGATAQDSYANGAKIKAQIDELRTGSVKYHDTNLVLIIAGPDSKKWSTFNASMPNQCLPILNQITDHVKQKLGASVVSISIDSHSGGGLFAMNIMDNTAQIPPEIHSIDFFDSLYWYNGQQHVQKIYNWLQSDSRNQLNLISATSPILKKQQVLISDLQRLGVQFQEEGEGSLYKKISGLNGQIRIKTLDKPSHGGTISWNGLAATKDPDSFDIRAA